MLFRSQEDVKALKEEFSEEGVPVKIVTQAINQIKRQKKMSDGEIFELDSITEWLLASREIGGTLLNHKTLTFLEFLITSPTPSHSQSSYSSVSA